MLRIFVIGTVADKHDTHGFTVYRSPFYLFALFLCVFPLTKNKNNFEKKSCPCTHSSKFFFVCETMLESKMRAAAARPVVDDIEWIIGHPDNNEGKKFARQEVLVAPHPLTRIETYDSKRSGLQAVFCTAGSWTANLVFDANGLHKCTYAVSDWNKGFSELAAKTLPLAAGCGLFELDSAVHRLTFTKSKGMFGDKKIYGFVFGINSDAVVCQLGVVVRPTEPEWLAFALLLNTMVLLVSLVIWIFAAVKVAQNKKRKEPTTPLNSRDEEKHSMALGHNSVVDHSVRSDEHRSSDLHYDASQHTAGAREPNRAPVGS
jgi:hypothetical protein